MPYSAQSSTMKNLGFILATGRCGGNLIMELVVIYLSVHICNFVFSLLSRSKPVLIPTLIVALCLINNNIRVLI